MNVSHRKIILTLGALTAIGPLSIDMYLPAFPEIARTFGSTTAGVEASLASYFFGLALGQLFYGTATDRLGRKRPLYFGLVLYIVSSVACAFAPSVQSLVFLRFFQALGACSGMVVSRAMVRDLFDHRESARIFSLLMLVMGIAPIVAPLVGGYVTILAGWRGIFGIMAVFSALCLAAIAILLPETRGPNPEVRISRTLSAYASILRDKSFLGYVFAGGFGQAGMFAYITGSPYVFIDLFGVPAQSYGWIFGTNALGLIALSQLNGRLLRTKSPDQILRFALAVIAVAGVGLAIAGIAEAGFWIVAPLLFFYVATLGMMMPNTSAGALARHTTTAGSASALMGTCQFLCAFAASTFVSAFHNGSAVPMTWTIGTCGCLAWIVKRKLT